MRNCAAHSAQLQARSSMLTHSNKYNIRRGPTQVMVSVCASVGVFEYINIPLTLSQRLVGVRMGVCQQLVQLKRRVGGGGGWGLRSGGRE